jgi:RNA polymerase sigma-70 factor, ECF subfamily
LIDATEHLPALRRYARALTLDASSADDLVQQALLRAYERADTFRAGSPLRAWLFAILHNEYVNGHRRTQAERRALDAMAEIDLAEAPAPEQAALLAETIRRFAALPEAQRAVLHLVAIEGLTYQQAADALNIRIGTVMSRLSRARAALRQPLAPAHHLHIVGGRHV